MRYRKKPVIIEAFQYDGDLKTDEKNIKNNIVKGRFLRLVKYFNIQLSIKKI